MPEVFDVTPIEIETPPSTDIITSCIDNPRVEMLNDFEYLQDSHYFSPEQKMYICGNLSIHTSEYSFDVEGGCALAVATSFKKFKGFDLNIGQDAYLLRKKRIRIQNNNLTDTEINKSISLIEALRLESNEKPAEAILIHSKEYLRVATILHIFSDTIKNSN